MAPRRTTRQGKGVVETTPEVTQGASSGSPSALAVPPPSSAFAHGVLFVDRPLSFECYFGHAGGMDYNVVFGLRREFPTTRDGSLERELTIHRGEHSTLRAIMTDIGLITLADGTQVAKPEFFFGDHIEVDNDMICVEGCEISSQDDDRFLSFPHMERAFPLSYFQSISCGRRSGWKLVEERNEVPVGTLTHQSTRHLEVKGLRPGEFSVTNSQLERTTPVNIFIRQFTAAHGEFPAHEFRAHGWTYSLDGGWWTRMIDFIANELQASLASSGLEVSVMAMRSGVIQNSYNFFAILEKYNPDSCTFFTPAGELGFALHEMYAASGLPLGELPYEEYVPGADELTILKNVSPEIYATLWEVMCHFHICAQLTGLRSGGIKQTSWAEYLFQNLHSRDAAVARLPVSSPDVIAARISASGAVGSTNFHRQAGTPISDTALLAGFLMIWLKRCVVPSKPVESILVEVVYPAVLLAHGKPIGLLPAMVGCLQHGLRELTSEFLDIVEIGPTGAKRMKTPQPRVPMPYTYLMAWFVMHCPSLMTGVEDNEESVAPFIRRLKSAQWAHFYIVTARKILSEESNYRVFCCFPDFGGVEKRGQWYMDVAPGGFSSLPGGIFRWLLVIRPGYLIYRLRDRCIIEPYLPSRFARQFGYDQLYVGNPNPKLATVGNLYEGARAWYYWAASNSTAVFALPSFTLNPHAVIGYCDWYREAALIPGYNMYASCLKDIREMYESRKDSRASRLKGIDEYLACEQEASGIGETRQGVTEAEVRRGEVTGKRALTAEETARYDKRARQGLTLRSRSHSEPKLMQEAIRSAPAVHGSEREEKLPVMPTLPTLTPSLAGSDVEEQEIITVDETTVVSPSFYLSFFVRSLGGLLRCAADYVMSDRGSFEVYRPRIMRFLDRIKQSGGDHWLKRCTDRVSRLEADLEAFQELECADLDAEVAQSLVDTRGERASQQELLPMSWFQKKEQVSSLQERRDRTRDELAQSTIAVTASQEAIARLEAELAEKRANLVREQATSDGLRRRVIEIDDHLQREAHALEVLEEELSLSETQLKEEITERVRSAHEAKLADLKLRLTVIHFDGP